MKRAEEDCESDSLRCHIEEQSTRRKADRHWLVAASARVTERTAHALIARRALEVGPLAEQEACAVRRPIESRGPTPLRLTPSGS